MVNYIGIVCRREEEKIVPREDEGKACEKRWLDCGALVYVMDTDT